MSRTPNTEAFGTLTEPGTLTLQRVLPGPIERVWAHLTESELRRKWLAAGDMKPDSGTSFEFVWRNDELACPPSERPAGFPDEHRMLCLIKEFDPPRKLVFTWNGSGDVSFELEPQGKDVRLTLIHRRVADRSTLLNIGAGWHMHLDLLVATVKGSAADPFWDGWLRLKQEYDRRLPA